MMMIDHQPFSCSVKTKIHYTSFPVASPQQVGNKLARAKVRCVCCVVSFPKFHYNDLLPTSITSTLDPRVHPLVTYFQFHVTTFHWVLVLFISQLQNMEFLTSSHSAVSNTLLIETSFEDPLLLVSLCCPLAPIPNAPWFSFETLALCKSLTYLLTSWQLLRGSYGETGVMDFEHKLLFGGDDPPPVPPLSLRPWT